MDFRIGLWHAAKRCLKQQMPQGAPASNDHLVAPLRPAVMEYRYEASHCGGLVGSHSSEFGDL